PRGAGIGQPWVASRALWALRHGTRQRSSLGRSPPILETADSPGWHGIERGCPAARAAAVLLLREASIHDAANPQALRSRARARGHAANDQVRTAAGSARAGDKRRRGGRA